MKQTRSWYITLLVRAVFQSDFTTRYFPFWSMQNCTLKTESTQTYEKSGLSPGGGGASAPTVFDRSVNLSSTGGGGRLCPPQYYQPPRNFRPCDWPENMMYISRTSKLEGGQVFQNWTSLNRQVRQNWTKSDLGRQVGRKSAKIVGRH